MSPHWVDTLPMVLLGIRTSLKTDIDVSAAELVYGTTLHIPEVFFTTSSEVPVVDPSNFVLPLKDTFRDIKATPPRQQQRKVFVHEDIITSTHVFLCHDAVRKPLQPPYDGLYKVLKCNDKHFTFEAKGRKEVVSIDRLKPAYLDFYELSGNHPAVVTPSNQTSPPPSSTCIPTSVSSNVPRVSRSGRHILIFRTA